VSYTYDTGMLVALERRKKRALDWYALANAQGARVTVPSPVLGEWWRGRTDAREKILSFVRVEPLSEGVAKLAGEAIARVRGATLVDAVVMASAALRGDSVFTSDLDDLMRLATVFPNVRLFQA
jgi:predicted nucleic acid-binding protein